MPTTYADNPPQFFPSPVKNNSINTQGYYVTVTDGTTNIFRKGKTASGQEQIENIGSIPKAGRFAPTGRATNEERQYFTANANKTVTDQAVPLVRRSIGGNAGGGNDKINDILGTKLATQQTSQPQQGTPFAFKIPEAKKEPLPDGDNLIYPIDMKGDQDRITFTAVTYEAPNANSTGTINRTTNSDRIKTNLGRVILPVQASITDNNSVDWQGSSLNEIERRVANFSLDLQTIPAKGLTKVMEDAFRDALNSIKENEGAIRVAFAGAAVGIQNLLGRYGAVLNPNLELLFSGPQLRPFNFTFKLSPRSEEESLRVRTIINFFKKNMAAKVTVDNIFLKSPNTFFIKYEGVGSNGLNKIKECALTNCSVDYTPLGTYMTYKNGTMVSYTLNLQFQEIEPIYNSDYTGNPNIIEY